MSNLSVNHNVSAVNTHRQLLKNDKNLAKSLERLSTGQKINSGVDGPAALVVSEQMRAQTAGLEQAISNSETAVSMIQTAEGGLNEVNGLLVNMRQLAIHAANEGANDEVMLMADQQEINNQLSTIDRIAKEAQFGSQKLLDGSRGPSGMTTGAKLEFIGASEKTLDTERSTVEGSGGTILCNQDDGYDVSVTQAATKTNFTSGQLTQDMVSGRAPVDPESCNTEGEQVGITLTVYEGGKKASYTTTEEDTVETAIENLRGEINRQELALDLTAENGVMNITHKKFGDDTSFQVQSSIGGVFSAAGQDNTIQEANTGKDIEGTINGEAARGDGQVLTGVAGSDNIDGLKVKYTGSEADLANAPAGSAVGSRGTTGHDVGRVHVRQNALRFQIGANRGQTVGIGLMNAASDALAKDVANESGFGSLSEIDVTSFKGSQDAITMIDKAIEEVSQHRGNLGAFQKNTLESNISNLRVASENMIAAESSIRDTDMASEMANFTKNQIMKQASTAMLAQANQQPNQVMRLLG